MNGQTLTAFQPGTAPGTTVVGSSTLSVSGLAATTSGAVVSLGPGGLVVVTVSGTGAKAGTAAVAGATAAVGFSTVPITITETGGGGVDSYIISGSGGPGETETPTGTASAKAFTGGAGLVVYKVGWLLWAGDLVLSLRYRDVFS